MKQPGRQAAAERARAARRAAQLRREAEERVEKEEAERKLDDEESLGINDVLALLGSAFRLREDTSKRDDAYEQAKRAWQDEEIEGIHVDDIMKALNEAFPKQDSPPAQDKPKARKTKAGDYPFTAEEIARLRDEVGLSWRQVAVNLDLGSPGAARKAYTTLTGKDYRDSEMTGRRARTTMGSAKASTRKVYAPDWTDETDQDEIIERLAGARIIVERNVKGINLIEDMVVSKVVKLTWDGTQEDAPLCVHFVERQSGGQRSVRVQDIKEVR